MNIETLRQFCLSLPHVTEDVKWEKDLCFCIGEKMFCVTGLADEPGSASFKTEPETFVEMTARSGIDPAPYLARYKWVVAEFTAMTDKEWEKHVRHSYDMIKSKLPARIRKSLAG